MRAARFILLPLAAMSTPALAADRQLDTAVATLNDPATQDKMADMVGALVDAVMAMPVGRIAKAAERMDPDGGNGRLSRIDPDATVGDLAGRSDPRFAEKLDADVRDGTRMMGVMAASLAEMVPVLESFARDLDARLANVRSRARR